MSIGEPSGYSVRAGATRRRSPVLSWYEGYLQPDACCERIRGGILWIGWARLTSHPSIQRENPVFSALHLIGALQEAADLENALGDKQRALTICSCMLRPPMESPLAAGTISVSSSRIRRLATSTVSRRTLLQFCTMSFPKQTASGDEAHSRAGL